MHLQSKARQRVFWSTLTNIKKSVHKADFSLAVTIEFILSSPLGLTVCRSSEKFGTSVYFWMSPCAVTLCRLGPLGSVVVKALRY